MTALLCVFNGKADAQRVPVTHREVTQDAGVLVGFNAPLGNEGGGDYTLTATYARHWANGLGYRTGLHYSADIVDVSSSYGIPLAISYRTRHRTGAERFETGAYGAASAMGHDILWGRGYYSPSNIGKDMLGAFLMSLLSDMELFVGITPGLVTDACNETVHGMTYYGGDTWEESWPERRSPFLLTLDAGMAINYSIWRFDIKVVPSFHYVITDSYRVNTIRGEYVDGQPYRTSSSSHSVNWIFNISGGLAFRF